MAVVAEAVAVVAEAVAVAVAVAVVVVAEAAVTRVSGLEGFRVWALAKRLCK